MTYLGTQRTRSRLEKALTRRTDRSRSIYLSISLSIYLYIYSKYIYQLYRSSIADRTTRRSEAQCRICISYRSKPRLYTYTSYYCRSCKLILLYIPHADVSYIHTCIAQVRDLSPLKELAHAVRNGDLSSDM